MITAKPVYHNGIKYRSRLEARWAAFFKAMNFEFEYEPKTYDTSLGWYLPDFNLNGLIIEVKPFEPTDIEFQKLLDVNDQVEGHCIFLCAFPKTGKDGCVYFLNKKWASLSDIFQNTPSQFFDYHLSTAMRLFQAVTIEQQLRIIFEVV